ncbi:MAG: hypothetical protein ACOCQQ_02170 [Candidatus Nanoarchaeia archaeon]
MVKLPGSSLVRKLFWSTLLLTTGVVVGEKYEPLQTAHENKTYKNRSVEDDTPVDLFDYTTKIEVNEKGRLELYFGNAQTDTFYQVHKNGMVGPQDTLQDYFANRSVEDDTPVDFYNYVVEPRLNDKGRVELYLGNSKTGNFKRIHQDGTVGSCGEFIDSYVQSTTNKAKPYLHVAGEKAKNVFEHSKDKLYVWLVAPSKQDVAKYELMPVDSSSFAKPVN